MGSSCGANFVNPGAAGAIDGVTIVDGHEYAEVITDQFPAGGWTDIQGEENADKCAWISSGHGASQNITLSDRQLPGAVDVVERHEQLRGGTGLTGPLCAKCLSAVRPASLRVAG